MPLTINSVIFVQKEITGGCRRGPEDTGTLALVSYLRVAVVTWDQPRDVTLLLGIAAASWCSLSISSIVHVYVMQERA